MLNYNQRQGELKNMRYYDTGIKQFIRKHYFYSLTENKKVPARDEIITITVETENTMYGYSYSGRWKYDKLTGTWYRYDCTQWLKENGEFIEYV